MKLPKPQLPSMSSIKQHLNNNGLIYVIYAIGIAIIIYMVWSAIQTGGLKKSNNTTMTKQLESIPNKIKGINVNDGNYQHNLRDYYIMSSYNSCCGGNFNDSYVDYAPLKQVINRGARVLDFEIYSVDGKTVVAASPSDNYYVKGTYNSLPFADVMNKVNIYAFSHGTCPNANDPLFLHFRIKSKKPHVYEDMTNVLSETFKHRKLGKEYSYESHGENLGTIPIKDLQGKVVFMCSRANNMFETTPLNEYINIASGSEFLRELRNYDIKYTHNYNELIQTNKKNMVLSMPDLSPNDDNMEVLIHIKYGVQMPCMNFQNMDSNLEFYMNFFNDAGFAYVLKPKELRYIPVQMKTPTPQDPKLSYARRVIQKPYFKHEI